MESHDFISMFLHTEKENQTKNEAWKEQIWQQTKLYVDCGLLGCDAGYCSRWWQWCEYI